MLPKIESPTFTLEVPSTKDKINMRMMKVSDEKILLMAKESDDQGDILTAVKQVVQNCTVTDINIDDLAIFDIEYIFLQLRAHSVSDVAEVAYVDNEEVDDEMVGVDPLDPDHYKKLRKAQANATRTFKIDLKKVKVKFPEKIEGQIKINNKVGIHLRYPPASLYSDKEFLNATGDDLINFLIIKSIDTIYDGPTISYDKTHNVPYEQLAEFLDNLDVKVYNHIKEFFTNVPHLEHDITYTNKNNKERKITLTTLGDFLQL